MLQSGGPVKNDIDRRVRQRTHETWIGPWNEESLAVWRDRKCIPGPSMIETRIDISGSEQHSRWRKLDFVGSCVNRRGHDVPEVKRIQEKELLAVPPPSRKLSATARDLPLTAAGREGL